MLTLWQKMKAWSSSQDVSPFGFPPMPIIVGAPRSGTTLLRFMLDAHSELAIPPETGFLTVSGTLTGRGNRLRERFCEAVVNYSAPLSPWPDFEIPQEIFQAAINEVTPFTISEGFRTFYRLYAARHGKTRWGDKTPIYSRYMNVIRRILPESRFIHIIRDGRDAALSLRRMWFSPGWEIETQASYWRDFVLAGREAGVGNDDYLEVRYEQLVMNTEQTLKRICSHIDLKYEEQMLRYFNNTPERLKEHKGRVSPDGVQLLTQPERFRQQQRTTQPPDRSCVFAWKQTMDVSERKRFESVAGDLLQELGYEILSGA